MHTVEKRDRVRELVDVPFPSSDAPEPLVLVDESSLVVSYVPVQDSSGPAGSPAPEPATIVVFRGCYASHFGLPNDEVFASHRLAGSGLRPCGAFEVESSSWVRGLEQRNRGHPRHDPQVFERLRHWVWTFQDSVLECAALSYVTVGAQAPPGERLSRMHGLLRSP